MDTKDTLQERKAQLIRLGEYHRAGILHAKASIQHGARPETMFHHAMEHASHAIRGRLDGLLRPTGASVGQIMPYVMPALAYVRRSRFAKPLMGMAALAAVAGWYWNHRRQQLAM
jgi:hypothetical protein